jgi:hypothetical protein
MVATGGFGLLLLLFDLRDTIVSKQEKVNRYVTLFWGITLGI